MSRKLRSVFKTIIERDQISEKTNFEYFKKVYKEELTDIENELVQFAGHQKSFENYLREIKIDEKLGVREMYQELLHLTSIYSRKNEVFHITSDEISFSLPDKTMILIKIKWLYEKLLLRIIPEIENNLNFSLETYEEESNMIKGVVNWNDTIVSSFSRGEKFPLQFKYSKSKINFQTPENMLASYCVLKFEDDVKSVLMTTSKENILREKDFKVLDGIKRISNRLRTNSHLQEVFEKMEPYSKISTESKIVKNLERNTLERIQSGLISHKAYAQLIVWLKEYRGHNLPSDGKNVSDFPFHHEKSVDILFQYWVFFRMIDFLVTKKDVRIIQVKISKKGTFEGFDLAYGSKKFKLLHEYEEPGWTGAISNPDFVLEQNGKFPIIMDPKNYNKDSSEGGAYHKMLGYLFNLTSRSPTIGILFFSEHGKYQIDENGKKKNIVERSKTVDSKWFRFITCVIHPKNSSLSERDEVFEHVFDIIKRVI